MLKEGAKITPLRVDGKMVTGDRMTPACCACPAALRHIRGQGCGSPRAKKSPLPPTHIDIRSGGYRMPICVAARGARWELALGVSQGTFWEPRRCFSSVVENADRFNAPCKTNPTQHRTLPTPIRVLPK